MRVGILTTSYPRDDADHAGTFVRGFADWLAARADIDVVCERPFDGEAGPEALERSWTAWPRAGLSATTLLLRAAVRARSWDALVSHWLLPCGAVGALVARGRPHVAIAHSGDVHLAVRLGLAPMLARVLARGVTQLVFVSEDLREKFFTAAGRADERLSARTIVCPMGTDAGPLPTSDERTAARARWFPDAGDRLCVGFLGRLVPIKGAGDLLEAAAKAGVCLRIAGDGPLSSPLSARARELAASGHDVALTGRLPATAAARRDFYSALDVLVVPSIQIGERSEGAPVVIAEAHAHGIPVLGTRTGGIPEAIAGAGIVVAPGSAALEKALEKLSMDSRILREITTLAAERASSVGWSHVGEMIGTQLLQ